MSQTYKAALGMITLGHSLWRLVVMFALALCVMSASTAQAKQYSNKEASEHFIKCAAFFQATGVANKNMGVDPSDWLNYTREAQLAAFYYGVRESNSPQSLKSYILRETKSRMPAYLKFYTSEEEEETRGMSKISDECFDSIEVQQRIAEYYRQQTNKNK